MSRWRGKDGKGAAAVSPFRDVPGRPWWGLYVGMGRDPAAQNRGKPAPDPARQMRFAGPESSVMVIGPPRSGKTSSIVVPCVLDAPAAVVSTSTKPDVLAVTAYRRYALGNCYVFDPSGTTVVPLGAVRLRWSPVTGCEQWERAVSTAHALASASRPHAILSESSHWVERAEALLAPLLFAAAVRHRDMATVCRWVLARDLREPEAVLRAAGHEMAEAVLAGVAATEDRERSGIFSTTAGLLAAYRSEAALAGATNPNFDPVTFASSTDTVYVCAPGHAQEQLAPVIVALLEQIREAALARPKGAAPVVFALDEVAGIAPLPSLPALAAEGGGQGLVTLACLQDLSQARARWGEAAEGFFSLFDQKLVFPGIGDYRTLHLISALAGDVQVPVRTVNDPGFLGALLSNAAPSVSTSVTWRPRMPIDEVSKGVPGWVLRIRAEAMDYLAAVPWWRHPVWSAVANPGRPAVHRTGSLDPRAPGSPVEVRPAAGRLDRRAGRRRRLRARRRRRGGPGRGRPVPADGRRRGGAARARRRRARRRVPAGSPRPRCRGRRSSPHPPPAAGLRRRWRPPSRTRAARRRSSRRCRLPRRQRAVPAPASSLPAAPGRRPPVRSRPRSGASR